MVKFKLVGQTTYQIGKPLWEILGNLQNNGVGRLVTRGQFLRYKEPSFYKIVKVEGRVAPEIKPNEYQEEQRRCIAWVEFTFRGNKMPKYREISTTTYKSDYQLIPKDEEELWYKRAEENKLHIKIINPFVRMPVLLKEIYKQHKKTRGEEVTEDPKLKVLLNQTSNNAYRIAEEGETPNYHLAQGFGTPKTSSLYENIDLARPLFVGKNAWDVPPPTKKIDWMVH